MPEAGDTYRFAVMGDNRPHGDPEKVEQPEVFRQIIREVSLLDPDFSMIVGDLILGYDPDVDLIGREWDAFDAASKALEHPYRLVPGNHDIWNRQSEAVWRERYGPARYAFTHGGSRFIVLNSEGMNASGQVVDRILPDQIAWLESELAAARNAPHVFVFLHKPLWRYPQEQTNWMAEVHPILRSHPSVRVFAGHWHNYEKCNVRDGIRYTITGGAGAEIGNVEENGDFFHYLVVSVRGPEVTVAVVRPGRVLPEDIVEEDRRQLIHELGQGLDLSPMVMGRDGPLSTEVRVTLKNLLGEDLDLEVKVSLPEGSNWRTPLADSSIRIPPGETRGIAYRLELDGDPFPAPVVHAVGRAGGKVVLDQEGSWPLKFDRRLDVVRVSTPLVVDGKLDEPAWREAPSAGRFLRLDGSGFAKRATAWRALWDDENLYLSFEMIEPDVAALVVNATQPDWRTLADDAVVFYLDVVGDGKSKFCFGVNGRGVALDYAAPMGTVDLGWSGPWTFAAVKGEKGWTVEVSIPWKTLGYEPASGKTFAVAAFRNAVPGEREFTGWTLPQSGGISNPAEFGEAVLK